MLIDCLKVLGLIFGLALMCSGIALSEDKKVVPIVLVVIGTVLLVKSLTWIFGG